MTIYWNRCNICGKHRPTKECSVLGKTLSVCFECAVALIGNAGDKCRNAWGIPAGKEASKRDKIKEIEELLKILE